MTHANDKFCQGSFHTYTYRLRYFESHITETFLAEVWLGADLAIHLAAVACFHGPIDSPDLKEATVLFKLYDHLTDYGCLK